MAVQISLRRLFPALRYFSKEADAVDYAHDHGRRVINEKG